MRKVVFAACAVLIFLQYTLWFGPSGHFTQLRLQHQLDEHKERVIVLAQRNQILTAQVIALTNDPAVLEARARHDLGLVKTGEVFFLVPEQRF